MSGSEPPAAPWGLAVWREPTSLIPLKWGRYTDRYLWGLILIISGTTAMQAGNIYAVSFLGQGIVALVIGWSIMPARGWRRTLAAFLAPLFAVALLTGPQSVWTLAVPYLLWLCVRHRPLRSYITVLFPIANGFIVPQFFEEYDGMPLALAISMVVFVASAWLARLIARQGAAAAETPNDPPFPSKTPVDL
ncbi:MAG TPA: hypothetical protein PLJ54_03535 [Rhodoglobus sp.]|nr:hypothetical protein [Rhodoglobus sp.]